MATVDEIGQEKQRIFERLARLDAERTKLGDHSRAGNCRTRSDALRGEADTTARRRRGRPARTAPAAAAGGRKARGGQQAPSVSLSDATLQAVQAHGEGATATDVLTYLSREFG